MRIWEIQEKTYLMEKDKIISIVKDCLNSVYTKDTYLFDIDIDERSINHRLAMKLSNELEDNTLKVDVEFNRRMNNQKTIDENGFGSIDILIHHRGIDTHNICAFECKKDRISQNDLRKINALLRPPYNYQYGITIEYNDHVAILYQMIDDQIIEEKIIL